MKIIPIFIPHAGCPYKCVYCDQHRISGVVRMPTAEEVKSIIKRNLKTIPKEEDVEVAFFGGTFTFLPERVQERYLDAAKPHTLRMSTHPASISLKAMKMFKKKGGRIVELGIQSLDKGVLKKIKREGDVRNAVKCIKKAGLKLGVQVMLGLPGDTLEKSIETAKKLTKLKPETARIYPTLVIKGTELAKMKYKPLTLEKAIDQAAKVADIFESGGVKVIRIGLHPSKDLGSKKTMLAGPYHPAFGEMVRARQMRNRIIRAVKDRFVANRSCIEIHVPENMFSLVSGHKGTEKKFLEKYFSVKIVIREDKGGWGKIRDARRNIAIIDPKMPRKAKDKLKRLNFHVAEVPLHKKLAKPVAGHVDMMLFKHGNKIIYEPSLEKIAGLLRQNGYNCIKGEPITFSKYPKDIIYNACSINYHIIHYKGKIEKNIKSLKAKHVLVNQGYAKCSIVPVDKDRIITSDKGIKELWKNSLFVKSGHVKLPGYKTGFIGGSSGVTDKVVFFVGKLENKSIRDFIRKSGKGIIELYNGPLYDVGTILFLPCLSKNRVLY
ncbi:MAG: radical SAM protein [Candidatus Gorgyraea atricola]|nr:radical SAM protein [Candidatus Gorgyraea atricola]